jgi:hypothetical protein
MVLASLLLAACGTGASTSGEATTSMSPLAAVGSSSAVPGTISSGKPATSSTAKPSSTSRTTQKLTKAPEDVAAAKFAQLLNTADAAGAVALTEPGSPAHLYAEGVALLADGRYASLSSEKRAAPTLSAFVLAPDGLITSLSRNGVSHDKIIAPGDGHVFTAEPGEYDSWKGSVVATVHSFRLFDGQLQIVMTNTNHATAEGGLSFTDYAANGKGYNGMCCGMALPNTTETSMSGFDGAPGGGTAQGRCYVSGSSNGIIELAVPAIG